MVCFCHQTMGGLPLPQLNASAELSLSAQASLLAKLAAWLGGLGLPAAPWTPNPSLINLSLPTPQLSASAMATISAFAQLRADVLAQFGLDLLVPGQANAFLRMVATLQARLSAMAGLGLGFGSGISAWGQLAATMSAVAQVQAAAQLGLFVPGPPAPSLAPWQPFLISLRALLPLIAASGQLGLSLSENFAAQLSAMLRTMLQIQMPSLPLPSISASLTAALSAIAQLRASLGIDPLAVGLPGVQAMVAAKVSETANLVMQQTGLSLPVLLLRLPQLEFCPTLLAPPAVVSAAASINAQALAAMNWQVPAVSAIPLLNVGLPMTALAMQLKAALNITPSLSPCGACDAAALLRTATA
jgi:hypothetical protein